MIGLFLVIGRFYDNSILLGTKTKGLLQNLQFFFYDNSILLDTKTHEDKVKQDADFYDNSILLGTKTALGYR